MPHPFRSVSLRNCALLAFLLLAGCGDSDTSSFSTDCALCVQGSPTGPSASVDDCVDYGAEFRCSRAVLVNEGMCDDGTPATCEVSGCAIDPAGGCTVFE